MAQLLLVIIYVSFVSIGLPDSLLGSAWPSMYAGLGVPVSYAGVISMVITGCTIVSSLFSARFVRRFGNGVGTALSVGMTAAALFGFSFSRSFAALCLWAVPYGLGIGSVDTALNNFVALHYQARHMNWLHFFWGIGATVGPYIMGASLTGGLGWNSGYRVVALVQVALTAVLVLSLPLWKKQTRTERAQASASAVPPLRFRQIAALPGAKQILAALFCYCSLQQVSALWGSSYLVLQKGVSAEEAASLLSLYFLGITAGRLLSGFLTLKLSARAMIRLGQGTALAGLALLALSGGVPGLGAGLALMGLGCAPIYPGLLHQTPERFGEAASQSMMGLQMAFSHLGNTVSPPAVGFLTQHLSISLYPLFQVLFLAAMVLAVESGNRCPAAGRLPAAA